MGFFKASGLSKECDKAAQILKSFIGMYCSSPNLHGANVVTDKGKIPNEAIANAYGVAIFTGFRAGMYLAGAGGSGVVVARLSDGSWSPPSAFSVRSGSFGLVYGVDVYDCVCVLNTQDAVNAYTKSEVNLGGAIALAAGPMSIPTQMKDIKPVWVYTKSRGFYGGLTVDGTVISQKPETNADFYGVKVSSEQILKGEVAPQNGATKWPMGATKLTETLKLAEGKKADSTVLQEISNEPTPGDLQE
jgi:lipid-binding SYLF domain-containing protein